MVIKKFSNDVFPSLLVVFFFSTFLYYYNFLIRKNLGGSYLIWIYIVGVMVGYQLSKIIKKKYKISYQINHHRLKNIARSLLIIGILSHIIYYLINWQSLFSSYADTYLVSRGMGFITVFFDFIILGFGYYEILINSNKIPRRERILIKSLEIFYVIFYLFILKKRRQILILLITLLINKYRKVKVSFKISIYILAILFFAFLLVFGRLRNHLELNGMYDTFKYMLDNFSLEWISMSNFEGKYISNTHEQVYYYVKNYGNLLELLLGAIFIIVPRSILPFNKPLSFPDWNTMTFDPIFYSIGGGYGGSIIIENYLILDVVGIIIFSVFIGLLIGYASKLRKRSNLNSLENINYSWIMYIVIFLPRLDLASLFMYLVFIFSPISLANKYISGGKI